MKDISRAIVESSKAIQETAKTTGQAIGLAQNFGGFISRYVGGSLEQGMGIFEDKLRYIRWERQVRFMERANQLMEKIGQEKPTKPIPMKLAIPLFQSASLEEDDNLQDMWAKLLVNVSVIDREVELRRAYIDILERISPVEALILNTIYSFPIRELQHNAIITENLPNAASILDDNDRKELVQPSTEIVLSLANLARLGCIGLPTTWNGGEMFTQVYPAVLGHSLVEACRLD